MALEQALAVPAPKGWAGPILSTARDLAIPLAILAIVVALITPLPPFLLDFLLAVDIMMSVVVLMVSVYIRRPTEFSVFRPHC